MIGVWVLCLTNISGISIQMKSFFGSIIFYWLLSWLLIFEGLVSMFASFFWLKTDSAMGTSVTIVSGLEPIIALIFI
jgi:hypothetical protein